MKILIVEGALKPEGVQSVISYIKSVIDNSKREKYTAKQAISITHDIEKSMIEF